MPIDIHHIPDTYAGRHKQTRGDLQKVINANVLNAVNDERLKEVPEELQMREALINSQNIGAYETSIENGKFILSNGSVRPFENGDKIRFTAPDNNSVSDTIKINKIDYPLLNTDDSSLNEGEIQKYHEVLLEYNEGKFKLVPTSSAPLLNMPIYQGPNKITVNSIDSLINVINSLNNKLIISNVIIILEEITYEVTQEIILENIKAINCTVTITTINNPAMFERGTQSDISYTKAFLKINNCSNIQFKYIIYNNFEDGIIISDSKNILFDYLGYSYISNYAITLINSNSAITNIRGITKTHISCNNSNLKIGAANLEYDDHDEYDRYGITVYNSSTVLVTDDINIDNIAHGFKILYNSKLISFEDDININITNTIIGINISYMSDASINANIYISGVSVGTGVCVYQLYNTTCYIKNINVSNIRYLYVTTKDSKIIVMEGVYNNINKLITVLGNSLTKIYHSTVTDVNNIISCSYQSEAYCSYLDITNTEDNYDFISAIENSKVYLDHITFSDDLTHNTTIADVSTVIAKGIDVGETNIDTNTIALEGTIII